MIRRLATLTLAFLVALAPVASAAPKKSSSSKKTSSASVKKSSSSTSKKRSEPVEAYSVEDGVPKIHAASAILVDANTGEVLHSVNPDSPRPVASTQKLLTALIVAEDGGLDSR